MANQYTPEEIQEIFDRYHDAIAKGIPITKELAAELSDAKTGIKNYSYTLNQSLKQLGQTTKQTIGDIANGAKGVSVFNDSLSAAADTASTMAAAFGPLGVAVGLVIKALTFFVTTANKQSDKLFETFQNLSRTGSVGSAAMTDVYQSMQRFGYTIDELDKMTSVLAENSRDFAVFTGTAATGSKQLSFLVEGFRDARTNLQALGLSTDEQVRAARGYYMQMARLGRATAATSSGALDYIKNMEVLTRLTGLQRKELEDQRQAAEDIDQFYASLMDMDPKAAEQAYNVFNRLMSMDPTGKKARAFAVSMDGIISGSDDQMQSLYSTNFQLLEFAQSVKAGTMSADQYLQAESEARRQTIGLQKELARVGVTDMFGSLKNNVIQANKGLDPFTQQTAQATAEMNNLYNMMDPATRAQAQARIAQTNTSNALQDFINLGVEPATRALAALAEVVEDLTSLLPGSKPKTGYGRDGTATLGESLAFTAYGAGAGAMFGPPGVVVGGVGGFLAGEMLMGNEALGWWGQAGLTGKSTEGLDPSFQKKLQGVAHEYRKLTGKPIEIVSAKRTREKQTELYNDFLAGKSKYPVAPPGTSRHESGRAVDVPLDTANKLDSMGLLRKHGLSRPVPGDPIHIEGYAGFRGELSGPMSGYRPNVLMHGNEELSIRPSVSSTNPNSGASEGTMIKLIERVDDLIYLSKSQLNTTEKMLKYQQ